MFSTPSMLKLKQSIEPPRVVKVIPLQTKRDRCPEKTQLRMFGYSLRVNEATVSQGHGTTAQVVCVAVVVSFGNVHFGFFYQQSDEKVDTSLMSA